MLDAFITSCSTDTHHVYVIFINLMGGASKLTAHHIRTTWTDGINKRSVRQAASATFILEPINCEKKHCAKRTNCTGLFFKSNESNRIKNIHVAINFQTMTNE